MRAFQWFNSEVALSLYAYVGALINQVLTTSIDFKDFSKHLQGCKSEIIQVLIYLLHYSYLSSSLSCTKCWGYSGGKDRAFPVCSEKNLLFIEHLPCHPLPASLHLCDGCGRLQPLFPCHKWGLEAQGTCPLCQWRVRIWPSAWH